MGFQEHVAQMKTMIDRLKTLTSDLGLGNTGDEYKIISELFTYKFLNDKLLYEFNKREDKEEEFDEFVHYVGRNTAKMNKEHLISELFNQQSEDNFHVIFDLALQEVSELNKDIYSIETTTGSKKPLFEPLSAYLRDEDKELELAKRAINILFEFDFGNIYEGGFDYFSTVFEHLISDYNKDSGQYAEYFTPLFAGQIMADIVFDDTPVTNVSVYDPAAGSGTLLLSLASKIGTNNCTIYSQDISQKSTSFLRINLILNKLAHSLHNVKEGNTLLMPAHKEDDKLQKFDFIVSNPPFKTDFSSIIESLKVDPYNRFFAGVPNIPNKDVEKMAIYLCFLQHILATLADKGKAAVVVPTGFLTAKTGIPKKIREHIISEKMLRGVISMPPNIFANTGTNVSILFLDKSKPYEDAFLMDASHLGEKIKTDGKNQKTVLSTDDIALIINTFKGRICIEDLGIEVSYEDIEKAKHSFFAGQYFEAKIEYIELSPEEFNNKIKEMKQLLCAHFDESQRLTNEILTSLGGLKLDI
ncbi:class I SAM-dependent DNA methyltransferase [Sinanaerobacter sp. ZZT-01]|uniref:HsdM family class I SAM-dependent methyltransferase n=1 Tax=Sinanaerobacter sp. ZZT-01 TaxID=3111540 RepID=UPI002D79F801|nr:class I SAM-dependent DNA methyltransferase [Sinanaerobacter sp. ZZT-01]WRR92758.1 class I SAM-dependent DNA methyltransferase [Sinanaerobacter sp. ZZT-01]